MDSNTHRNRTLWLCTALHGFTHVYHVALIPLYLLIRKDFALTSDGQATFFVTVMGVSYFLPSYFMGILADRANRKKLLATGLTLNAAGFVALALAPNYATAVACLVLAGFGGSFYHPAATALIARLFPENTGKALGKVGIGASIGFFAGPIYSGWRAGTAGWRQPILELGILGLIGAALFIWLAVEHENPKPVEHKDGKKIQLFPTPLLWLLFLSASFAFCLRDFAGMGMATLSSLFLQRAQDFSLWQTGLTLSCIYLASVVSNPLFGGLSDRGRTRWTSAVLIAAAILIFIFPHLRGGWLAFALAAYGFFFMASYPMVEAALMEAVPDAVRGRVFGLFILIGGLLGNFSHWFIGIWTKNLQHANEPSAYFNLYNVLALCVLLSIAGLFGLHHLRRKEGREHARDHFDPATVTSPQVE